MERSKRQKQRKVLLMGRSGAGKSSMRSIIFSNYVAKDVRRLGATVDVEHSNIRFMGNLMLNLWDCGGQDSFVESYLSNQRSHVFTSVAVMIFVFDISSREAAADMLSFASTIRALYEFSPSSKIFVLIHKMDLVPADQKARVFQQKAIDVRTTCEDEGFQSQQVDFWATSIWDQSLYKAWTQVIYFLVPNASAIEDMLRRLANLLDARELILYERTTCLVVTHITRDAEQRNPYNDRFERISSILKTHKHSMAKHTGTMASEVSFAELQIKTGDFMFFITRLTENTNLAVVMPSDEASFNAARVNVQLARREFSHLDIVEKKGKDAQRQVKDALALEEVKMADDGEASSSGRASDR
ncbi:GTP-binding protein gtr1 [Elasticomyces elasticus]|nr:GTP-binding protein gtr1 [Elasticomyces elasticus]KAK3657037.1 GTP-binding protein gtr1 [Elasticomyces elasticus]KAK4916260.1 GTP-binding protein gtr1 [Elasticomyces elasticus]KAK5764203.1 GTP-binding protein gtr1 [Elasticomyces elasticus]